MLKQYPQYRILSVFLYAPKEELVTRELVRPQLPGRYRGRVDELEASIRRYEERFGSSNMDDYDLAVDVMLNSPEEVSGHIEEKMKQLLK